VKNKKKHYLSVDFKLNVVNILINSSVFDKISLYLFALEERVLKYLETKGLHILEMTDEKNLTQSVKNKIYFYQDINEISGESFTSVADKCILCDESFKVVLKNENNNITSEEESDEASNFAFSNVLNVVKCPFCSSQYHMICMAERTLGESLALIPRETECIICSRVSGWSDFIKNN
jgi:hypothetical protein